MGRIQAPTNARSRRTRAAVLGTARRLLEEEGFDGLTMNAVADRAGVTRRAVYLHFGSRAELVSALFDYVADAEGLDRSLQRVWDAPDAAGALDEWAEHVARYHPRLLEVDRAVLLESDRDADAAAHRTRVVRNKLASCRRLIARLVAEGRLARGWTPATAADMLFYLDSGELVGGLLRERRWSRRRFVERYAALLRATFLREPADPDDVGQSAGGCTPGVR
jgi:AcrR family transcriptional regulator